jgi:hypothetical protein
MDFKLRTSNSDLKTIFQRKLLLNELLSQLAGAEPRKFLFWGEGAGGISSYVAGWMASQDTEVILLDGANRFDPYTVSFFARSISIPPERLLRRIKIARAFTCYQMATLMGEKLPLLLKKENLLPSRQKRWIILLGPLSTFLDEDVPEREVRPLFERTLRRVEGVTAAGPSLLIFQSLISPHSKRSYLTRRLLHFSDWAWKIAFDDQEPRMVLEKKPTRNIPDNKPQITNKSQ